MTDDSPAVGGYALPLSAPPALVRVSPALWSLLGPRKPSSVRSHPQRAPRNHDGRRAQDRRLPD